MPRLKRLPASPFLVQTGGVTDHRLRAAVSAEQILWLTITRIVCVLPQSATAPSPSTLMKTTTQRKKIIEQTAGQRGVDAVIDAVGFEAKGSTTETILSNLKIEGSSGKALRQCIAAVRRVGW